MTPDAAVKIVREMDEHDCRCLKGLGFSDECGCGRDGLGEAMEAARAALEGKDRG